MSVALVLAAYLVGSIPFAFLFVRHASGVDIRRTGSGNIGTANVLRTTDLGTALSVFVLDFAKGAGMVLLAERLAGGAVPAIAGVAAVVGHTCPIWLGFRGGKGVATSCGVLAVLAPLATALAVVVFIVTVTLTRFISLGSIAATILSTPLAYWTGTPVDTVIAAMAISVIVVVRHRANVGRLWAGTERRLGGRAEHGGQQA